MEQTLEEWVARLEPVELPAFGHSLRELERLAADDSIPLTRLTAIVEGDLGLTLRLMRRINAVGHKHLRSEVKTVRHGLMMLGMSALQRLPEGVPTIEQVGDKAPRVRLRRGYARAVHAASQAREWSRWLRDIEPDEAYLAALLHGLGEMLVGLHSPARLTELERLKHGDEMEAEEAEFVTLGFALDRLTSRLAAAWGLPSLVDESLQPENTENRRVRGIMLAGRLARAAERDWYAPETTAILEQVADLLGCSFGSAAARAHRTAVDVARDGLPLYGVRPAAARLLLPTRPEAAPGWSPTHREEPPGEFCLCPQPAAYAQALARLRHPPDQVESLHDLLELALKGLHEGLALNRVLFALMTPAKTQLKVRGAIGAEGDARFNRLTLDLDEDNLFSRLIQKPQALWYDDSNRDRFLPLLPEIFQKAVGVPRFFVMSVFVKGHPVGCFYADRHNAYCGLDSRSYHRFKELVLQAGRAMEAGRVKGYKT